MKLPLILGCDSNAHKEVWGSTNANIRGEYLLEFITSKKLEICNVGNTPTFVTILRKEVLDITIGNIRGCELVKNWRVSNKPSMSDHRIVRFNIEGSPINKKILRNPRKSNWENYTENLKYNLVQLGLDEIIQNEIQLENNLENLNGAILNAYEDSCPLSLINSTKDVPRWNNDLKNLRNIVRGLFNYSKRTGDWSEYRQKLTLYNREIRASKRRSFQKFCDSIESITEVSRLYKVLAKSSSLTAAATNFKREDGSFTEGEEEKIQLLLDLHFPGSSSTLGTESEHTEPPKTIKKDDWKIVKNVITMPKISGGE
ncbi:uncharacterized protein LOC119665518 [Teleopsis dalmanni]|uniref:uncharacterized protein LOC119665518 n=1 Tax=Teleopsis dalmanni TaxID=139649 RepID=UPI0018CF045B|nr:uncharacterized protein LOC119665518 [Teleopsis dalmanni]